MLRITNLSSFYGSVHALKEVSLQVGQGEIVTIIGPNGSGKTTLLRTVSGLHRASGGSTFLEGREITHLGAHQIVRAGVTHVLQGRQIFEEMTVLQNLRIGAYHRFPLPKEEIKADLEEVYSYFPLLLERTGQKGGTLSGGEQVMLAIGRALMAKPNLLLLDEPSLGLAPKVVDVVFETLQKLYRSGRTIVLVEQNAELAFDLAQRCYLMVLGKIILEGNVEDIKKSDKVIDLYLGNIEGQ
jgi:branched-chain amino acid transport system ATP-binding protein